MRRSYSLIFALILLCSTKGQTQDFNSLTSQIFFNLDINNHDTAFLSLLETKPELIPKPKSGWTVYPPTDKEGNPIPYFTFTFSSHPFFTSIFKSGGLMVLTNKDSKSVKGLSLSLSFNSQNVFDSTYKSLKKLYTAYSSKVSIRPNLSSHYEETRYLSKDKVNYVIISKGEDDDKPYLIINYNYQQFDW